MKGLKAGLAGFLLLATTAAHALTESFIQGTFASPAEGSTDWHGSVAKRIIPASTGYLVIGNNEVLSNQDGGYTTGTTLYALKLTTGMARDTSFGVNGVKSLQLPEGYYYRSAFALPLASGKFLVAAEAIMIDPPEGTVSERIVLARFNADATRDTSFASSGATLVDMPCTENSRADVPTLNIQADGRIILTGTFACPDIGRAGFVARFSATGTQEMSFGLDGLAWVYVRGTQAWLTHAKIDSEGRLVVAGESIRPTSEELVWNYDTFVARITLGTTPAADTTFNGAGYRIISAADDDNSWPTALHVQGSTVMVVTDVESTSGESMVTKLLGNGTPDTSFGTSGSAMVSAGGYQNSYFRQILPATSGYYLVGGLNNRRAVVKITSGGELDTSDADFAGTGFWRSSISAVDAFVTAILNNGKLIAAGLAVTDVGVSIDPENDVGSSAFVVSSFPVSGAPGGGSSTVTESSSSGGGGGGSADVLGLLLLAGLVFMRRRQR